MKRFFKHKAGQRGFTLIELLVVIAIIGILSSVVLASLNSARVKARDARRVADLKQIQIALELWYDTNGQYPDEIADLKDAAQAGSTLASEPKDPQAGTSYIYAYKTVSSKKTAYHVGANLEAASGATTLDDGDNDLDTYTTATTLPSGWSGSGGTPPGINGADSGDCAADTTKGMCYDISNVSAP